MRSNAAPAFEACYSKALGKISQVVNAVVVDRAVRILQMDRKHPVCWAAQPRHTAQVHQEYRAHPVASWLPELCGAKTSRQSIRFRH